MQDFIAELDFPTSAEIRDHTCLICREDSPEEDGTEIPVKLRCGHALRLTVPEFSDMLNHKIECSMADRRNMLSENVFSSCLVFHGATRPLSATIISLILVLEHEIKDLMKW